MLLSGGEDPPLYCAMKLSPIAVFGGFWFDPPSMDHPEIALVSVVYTQERLWVLDYCDSFVWESFQPYLPIWWFRYLMLTGGPPAKNLLQDQETPIAVRIEKLTEFAKDIVYPFTRIGFPAAFKEYYHSVHPEWVPIDQGIDYLLMEFSLLRTYATALNCAPLQFRNYNEHHTEVHSNKYLQAAIGIVKQLEEGTSYSVSGDILTARSRHRANRPIESSDIITA